MLSLLLARAYGMPCSHFRWEGHVTCHAVFSAGKTIGLLGMEMHTRRRNRANGIITQAEQGCLHIQVTESYGNCPKYIQVQLNIFMPVCICPSPVHLKCID